MKIKQSLLTVFALLTTVICFAKNKSDVRKPNQVSEDVISKTELSTACANEIIKSFAQDHLTLSRSVEWRQDAGGPLSFLYSDVMDAEPTGEHSILVETSENTCRVYTINHSERLGLWIVKGDQIRLGSYKFHFVNKELVLSK